jgi:hypothetical protein
MQITIVLRSLEEGLFWLALQGLSEGRKIVFETVGAVGNTELLGSDL